MAKGKPRAKFPEEYSSEVEEDARAAREARAKAPQGKPHRRGGVHQVKDEHLTDTKWDRMTRDEMVAAARDDLIYTPFFAKFRAEKQKVKDLKKHVLLRTLADADKELARRAKREKRENEKLRENAKIKAKEDEEERRAEQQRKQEGRLQKEEEGQILSDEDKDESESESEPMLQLPQTYLQQEDSDISDTTSTDSSESPTYPPHRLRIFEWSFNDPPSNDYWTTPRTWPQNEELQPRQLPYTPMNVMTMHYHEMLHTPGLDAKGNLVEPDRVPALLEEVKDCVRNGVLIGPLEGAVVESGLYWSKRTIVQGWNGRLYFNLPRADEDLAEVYRQWKSREGRKKRRMDRQPLYEAGVHKRDPRLREIRKKEQRKITKKVYRASQWRPTFVYLPVYLPAYYETPNDAGDETVDRAIKNLFYVRLKGESVPSFFFWADKDEWKNPTKPNPKYEKYKDQHSGRDFQSTSMLQRRLSRLIRVKKVPAPSRIRSTGNIKTTTRYAFVVWAIERDMYHFGFDYTLKFWHDKWLDEEKEGAWDKLTQVLRNQLPPSGRLPTHPPVRLERDPSMISIAEKMARVEDFYPDSDDPILPIYINDDWTRNDDAYWTTEERPRTSAHDGMDVNMQYATPISRAGRPVSRLGAPEPRPSPDTPHSLHRRISDVFAWVSTVSTPGSQFYNAPSPTVPKQIQEGTDLAFNIMVDRAPAYPFSHEMWTMMQDRYRFQGQVPGICAICLEELGDISLVKYEQHLINHMVNISFYCPFCGIHWESMDGENKAYHVRNHRDESYETDAWLKYELENPGTMRRRLTQTPPELQGNVAVPRRRPSVRFSRTTVGPRTAYNDSNVHPQGIYAPEFDACPTVPNTTGSDATFSSRNTTSSRRSSQNSQGGPDKPAAKVPAKSSIKKKSNLTIVTDNNGRRTLENDMSDHEELYRDAHDPRRKSSSDSMGGRDREMRVYTYVDDGEGWDRHSDSVIESESCSYSDSDSEYDGGNGGAARPGIQLRGGKARAGGVSSESFGEVGSGDEDEDSEHDSEGEDGEDEQDYSNGDEGSPDDAEGEDEDRQDGSGYGDNNQGDKEADDDSSGGSEDDGPRSLKESTDSSQHSSKNSQVERTVAEEDGDCQEEAEVFRSPSRKRARRSSNTAFFASSSGVTRYKRRRTSIEEPNSSPKAPTVSPLTPNSRRSSRTSRSSGRVSTFSQGSTFRPASPSALPPGGWEEWPAPAYLWYYVLKVEQQEEQASDEYEDDVNDLAEEHPEVLDGLSIEEAYALMSVKKGKRRHHVPRYQRHKPFHAPDATTSSISSDQSRSRRSLTPSPSSNLALAGHVVHNLAVPPNTPAVGDEGFEDRLEESLSPPPSPGLLSDSTSEKVGDDSDQGEDSDLGEEDGEQENEEESVERHQDESEIEEESDIPSPLPVSVTRQQAKIDAEKRKREKNRVSASSDETGEDNSDEGDVVPPSSENDDSDEPSQDQSSTSEDDNEEDVSLYQPPVSDKQAKKRAPPPANKQPAKEPTKKAQPRKRMTEAERLVAQAKKWGYVE